MKTAVIITGQTRTFARCLPSLHWHVFRKLENPHFYASVANDGDAPAIDLLKSKYPDAPVFIEKIDQPTLPEPPLALADHAPYAITPTRTPGIGPMQGILRQQWHMSRGYKFALAHGAGECDMFIRCRPDLHFHQYIEATKWLKSESSGRTITRVYMMPMEFEAWTPYWGNYGGVNDRFAILGKGSAKPYFETYDNLAVMLDEGCPFHPESLVAYSMERDGIEIHRTLTAEFAFRRQDGSLEHMVVLPQELAAYTAHLSK